MKNKGPEIYKEKEVNYNEFAVAFLYNRLKELETNTEGKINIALSGGITPLPILKTLKDKEIKWERYNFFLVDERCVPLDSDLSNFGNIYKVLENHVLK